MTIRKKRKILRSKRDRDLRIEILLTTAIRHLCQEIGDQLRSKRLSTNSKRKLSSECGRSDSDADTVRNTVKKSRHNWLTDSTGSAGNGLGESQKLLIRRRTRLITIPRREFHQSIPISISWKWIEISLKTRKKNRRRTVSMSEIRSDWTIFSNQLVELKKWKSDWFQSESYHDIWWQVPNPTLFSENTVIRHGVRLNALRINKFGTE